MSSRFPRIAKEMDATLELLVKDYVSSWYSEISRDASFSLLVQESLSSLTLKLEDALLRVVYFLQISNSRIISDCTCSFKKC